jgi:uncharacterized protein (DUF927 family)
MGKHSFPTGLTVPEGWRLGPGGIGKMDFNKDGDQFLRDVSDSPIVITGRLKSIDDDQTSLHLEWFRRGEWMRRIIPRHHAMIKRNLETQSEYDIPVSSLNSHYLIKWLTEFESINQANIPTARVSSKMGMIGKKEKDMVFLWGSRVITPGGVVGEGKQVSDTSPSNWQKKWVHLHVDGPKKKIVNGFRSEGTWEQWLRVIEMVTDFPKVMAGVYASAVPPLLSVIRDAPNFCIDWAGGSSLGKTTTLQIAASFWGCADLREPGPIASWNSTRVGVEGFGQMLNSIPIILDDTKKAKVRDDVGKLVYDVASGQGRMRGSTTSLRETPTFRTILLSSGESPLNMFTKDEGARARIIQVWGSPFDSANQRALVDDIKSVLNRNYGHCGPRLVQVLLNNRDKWPFLRAMYERATAKLAKDAEGNPIASRIAGYIAAIHVAREVLNQWLNFPRPTNKYIPDPVQFLFFKAMAEIEQTNVARDALDDVVSWAVSFQDTFYGQHIRSKYGTSAPNKGWSGVWHGPFDHLYFIASKLREVLQRLGYEPEGIIRQWYDLGWLIIGNKSKENLLKKQYHVVKKVNEKSVRCIAISKHIINDISKVESE